VVDFSRYQHIQVERRGAVLVLTLNRPDRLNALNRELHTELSTIFRDANRDEESMVVVLTGAGRGFCAGGDIKAARETPGKSNVHRRPYEVYGESREVVMSMLELEKPLIAMVNGPAAGAGATFALLCDIVVASDRATIGDRHVNAGLVAGDGGAAIWPLLIGVNRAKELLMTGRMVGGEDLLRLGLVNHLVPHEELEARTMAIAEELAALPPYAVRATKMTVNRLLRRQAEDTLDIGLAWEHLSIGGEDRARLADEFGRG
jgi:enoyl-CoA hydratase